MHATALVDFSIKGRTVVYKFGSRQASIEIGYAGLP